MAKAKSKRIPAAKLSTRARAGRRARNKGREFEELIARDLRGVYDSTILRRKMALCLAQKDGKGHRALLKKSRVRRTRQADGAVQSDLNVVDCEWWFELSIGKNVSPVKKLQQAEDDVAAVETHQTAIVITREKGANSIQATMRINTLNGLLVGASDSGIPGYNPIQSRLIVQIDYKNLLPALKAYEAHNGTT